MSCRDRSQDMPDTGEAGLATLSSRNVKYFGSQEPLPAPRVDRAIRRHWGMLAMDRNLLETTIERLLKIAVRCTDNPRLQGDIVEIANDLFEWLDGRPVRGGIDHPKSN
jgi:hypothetical protein